MNCARHSWTAVHRACLTATATRSVSTAAWHEKLARPVQAYISTSRDPYLNLSIENDALLRSAADSVLLFLYINRPSVIIGRNQNPWLEVNLPLLSQGRRRPETEPPGLGSVDLVRRRSGGGTVFHDEGNVNWTVICPRDHFNRNKHAEMVVRALRRCGIDRARVNSRHDIVLDQGERGNDADPNDTHATPYMSLKHDGIRPLKVSGSAYKITGKHRALHHGTCLLSSANLNIIPDYLHSPAKPYITEARGVSSVSSPVGNILLENEEFCTAVRDEFRRMYSAQGDAPLEEVGAEMSNVKAVKEGIEELKSPNFKYEQTPQFVVSNESDQNSPALLELTIRDGRVTSGFLSKTWSKEDNSSYFAVGEGHSRPKLHEMGASSAGERHGVKSWDEVLGLARSGLSVEDRHYLVQWLHRVVHSDWE